MRQALEAGDKMGHALIELGLPSFAGGLVWNGETGGPDRLVASLTRLADQLELEQQLCEPGNPRLFAYGLAFSRLAAMMQAGIPALQALEAAAASVTSPEVGARSARRAWPWRRDSHLAPRYRWQRTTYRRR
jgi:type II secretory pathway component PulF